MRKVVRIRVSRDDYLAVEEPIFGGFCDGIHIYAAPEGSVVEVETKEDGRLKMVRVVEKGQGQHWCLLAIPYEPEELINEIQKEKPFTSLYLGRKVDKDRTLIDVYKDAGKILEGKTVFSCRGTITFGFARIVKHKKQQK